MPPTLLNKGLLPSYFPSTDWLALYLYLYLYL